MEWLFSPDVITALGTPIVFTIFAVLWMTRIHRSSNNVHTNLLEQVSCRLKENEDDIRELRVSVQDAHKAHMKCEREKIDMVKEFNDELLLIKAQVNQGPRRVRRRSRTRV